LGKKRPTTTYYFTYKEKDVFLTTNGKSQEIPAPLCLAAMVVGPAKEGIQKKPSVNSPFKIKVFHNSKRNIFCE